MVDARRRAAALLRTQLLLVEEWAGQHLHQLLPALCKVGGWVGGVRAVAGGRGGGGA